MPPNEEPLRLLTREDKTLIARDKRSLCFRLKRNPPTGRVRGVFTRILGMRKPAETSTNIADFARSLDF